MRHRLRPAGQGDDGPLLDKITGIREQRRRRAYALQSTTALRRNSLPARASEPGRAACYFAQEAVSHYRRAMRIQAMAPFRLPQRSSSPIRQLDYLSWQVNWRGDRAN